MSSLTPEELREIRARHPEVQFPDGKSYCGGGGCVSVWPCLTIRILDHIDAMLDYRAEAAEMNAIADGTQSLLTQCERVNQRLADALNAIIRCGDMDTAISIAHRALTGGGE